MRLSLMAMFVISVVTGLCVAMPQEPDASEEASVAPIPLLVFAQVFIGENRALRPAEVDYYRHDGQLQVSRLFALREQVWDGVQAGANRQSELSQLDLLIDAIAGQRYASYSGLFWHTDMQQAQTRAKAENKPVLSLRMTGDLTDEYCGFHGRWHRIVNFADETISAYLREHFVLHWESIQQTARVTVDYADGRQLTTTLAGGCVHYVLNAEGQVVEALSGLRGPKQFLVWLERSKNAYREESNGNAGNAETRTKRLVAHADSLRKQSMGDVVQQVAYSSAVVASGVEDRIKPIQAGGQASPAFVALSPNSIRLLKHLRPLSRGDDTESVPWSDFVGSLQSFLHGVEIAGREPQAKLYQHLGNHPGQTLDELDLWVFRNVFDIDLNDRWNGMLPSDLIVGLPQNGVIASEGVAQSGATMPPAFPQPRGRFDVQLKALADELFGE